ncbi:MAG TPA: LD-carboxypeptidase [Blastocatellia bacterium]|nr:LD-carboxypeptidase [Blastocatellia bacterium]
MIQSSPVIKPPALRDGDAVAIVAPASNLKPDYLARGVAELERLGFRARYEPGILDKARYTAGDDERRAAELTRAFTDPEIKAVWAARGGYGSMRLFKLLDESLIGRRPKIFIGYSDITALSLYFYRRFGWVTFHGPMASKDLAGGEEHYDRETLIKAVTGAAPMGEIKSNKTEMLHRGAEKRVTGRLLGGCLSLITAMIGAPDELDTRGSILFLEDTCARPYAIDRMLQQLKLAGKFDEVRGIVFGEMTDCVQHADQGYRIQDVLAECTDDLNIPIMFGLPSGHSPRGNLTLPLGVTATLDAGRGALSIDEAAVE